MAFPLHSTVTRVAEPSDGYGSAWMDPCEEIVAGTVGTWRLIYEAGEHGIAPGGRIRIRTDSDTDWGVPQFLDPAADDFTTVEAPDGVGCCLQVGGPKSLLVRFHGRALQPGERVTVVLGDTRGGGPGMRAQTFLESRHDFLFEVDHRGDGQAVLLADSPRTAIVGGTAHRLVLIAPSSVVVGRDFRLIVKVEDCWGNSASRFEGRVELSGENLHLPTDAVDFAHRRDGRPMERGVMHIDGVKALAAGVLRVRARARDAELEALSNPMIATETPHEFPLHWADPHGGQIGSREKIEEFFRYARDVSGVQFVGYQRNADVISPEDWVEQQRAERELHAPGRFVPIPGFEWSGRTPEGGHHNVYFRRHDQPVRRNPPAEAPQSVDAASEVAHIRDVYDLYRNSDTIITPHVGGEHSNLHWHEPSLEPAMEITSSHGSFEWAIREIMQRGYQLGFLGGSDCYTGRPGDDRPGFQLRRYAKSGLTGIYAQDVTLSSFFEAMRARRVYATTGARIVLHVHSGGHWIGSRYTTDQPPRLDVRVVGTTSLESVEVFRGTQRLYAFPFEHRPVTNRVRLLWQGASRMSSYSGIVWEGTATAGGAAIQSVEPLRFDSPRSWCRLESYSAGPAVRWHAWGCGYRMGMILQLDGDDDAELQVAIDSQVITGPMYGLHGEQGPPRRISLAPADQLRFDVRLADLRHAPLEWPLGVLDRQVTVSLDHEAGPDSVDFQFTDEHAEPGVNPYWIRVVQSDQEMAWSSPIFIDYAAGST